mmetsp:Transcript_40382/g.114321  ORF Transcript_40382/g.114321 Transcript_40382/m.114321 type:complete len:462 (-) Transcript_40382:1655-3040(-)
MRLLAAGIRSSIGVPGRFAVSRVSHTQSRALGESIQAGRFLALSSRAGSRAMSSASSDLGALIIREEVTTATEGPLKGITFCVKDNFDIKGQVTGAGSPAWKRTHGPASETAPVVEALLAAGATFVGKTHMDELAYSLNGENVHYGTPVNVAAPGRIPGGSSSGSAAAVAGKLADLGIGSDTAGSVRVPASYCGILGFRPTHGRVSLNNVVPLAQSFDTAAWFARDASLLQSAGEVLLDHSSALKLEEVKWLVATDAFDLSDDETRQAIYDAMSIDFNTVTAILGPPKEITVGMDGLGTLEEWLDVFRVIQASEAWANFGDWIDKKNPGFGPGIKERFEAASKVTAEEVEEAKRMRGRIMQHVDGILGRSCVLALPTCPGPAPKLNTPADELELFRRRLLSLSALAPLCSLPQVTLPIAEVYGNPVGLSLIGPRGSDESLLELAKSLSVILPVAGGAQSTS